MPEYFASAWTANHVVATFYIFPVFFQRCSKLQMHRMGNNGKIQSVVLKMDTMTGKAWILQVQVMGGNEPKVRTSSWHEVGLGRKNGN